MTVILNGSPFEFHADTLADLLTAADLGEATVATAVNGTFVPATARAQHRLSEGDTVEVLAPMQGG
ncbi:MAG: sulfur carrier protein ThiS [Pseudomonadota bacterium]